MSGGPGTGRTFNFTQESLTKQNIEKVHFRWTIENFSHLNSPTGSSVDSCDFKSIEHTWTLKVYPNGEDDEDKDYLSIFVRLSKSNRNKAELNVQANYRFFLLSPDNESLKEIGDSDTFTGTESWGFPTFVKRSDLLDESKGYLVDDKLRLGVELIIVKEVETGPLVPKKPAAVDHEALAMVKCDMSDYSGFMNSKELSDVKIVNQDGKTLKAHKVILARNSVVLATTFEHPMKETSEGRVIIDKIRSEVLAQMLKFMYSAQLEEATKTNMELLFELLAAADLYEIAQLKTTCGTLLLEKMTRQTVTRLFELGETYRCSQLKEGALEFIVQNEDLVLDTEEWKDFECGSPQLAISIFSELRKAGSKRKAGESSTANSNPKGLKSNM